ncbi:origin recognition complex 1 protein, putative [Perkinsus marinus ATCC 50983]|uniref:Origin recognition complex subunit 1 n=1 Tax=Perkinsus marinus (strain ATCC 50983 / TXsc) TaxID=423536 RepID=C5LTD9_PERM5|nr:origin recognition complex 1 protein, putative [Perkinsus marinus ATCC 50983]EER00107.1 origin recognition complex 1 protein, putative [Perkinsus marinus ATCC 50983]|eukprot:XP_002767389.1 origin recognition complex 1 protein, putative [Perkinsus marinus ATCC 50983]
MGIFTWDVFKVSEDKPHRKGNDCKRIKADLVQCMQQTQCWKSGALFEECMQSKDPAWVTKECMHLRDAYMQSPPPRRSSRLRVLNGFQGGSKESRKRPAKDEEMINSDSNTPSEDTQGDDDDDEARLQKAAVEFADKLQLSNIPQALPCRDEERRSVYSFLWEAVNTGGAGNVLYISGMPGTGKTATVMGVVGELKTRMSRKQVPAFKFAYVNAFRLATPQGVFKELYTALEIGPAKVSAAVAYDKLDAYMRKGSPDEAVLVVVIDELDYLVTKQQKVLYCLFDWPTLPTSKLAVVAIANTMDLPERMIPRVASRLGFGRVNFSPYSSDQIAEIIRHRMEECGGGAVFESNAIKLCAMRVASVSGDIRKALHICRRAIELRKRGCKVTPAEINAAQSDTFSSVLVDKVTSLHTFHFRFMLAFIMLMRAQRSPQSITLHAIYDKMNALSYHHPPEGYNEYPGGYVMPFRDFEVLAAKLENWGIINLYTVMKNSLYLRDCPDDDDDERAGMEDLGEDLQMVTQKRGAKDLLSTADKQRSRELRLPV